MLDYKQSLFTEENSNYSGKPQDGLVSRYINRRFSRPISKILVNTPVTPNQLSIFSNMVTSLGGLLMSTGQQPYLAVGGIAAQIGSILDGCDGEIARAKNIKSSYGAWLDASLDRISDIIVNFGMAYGYWQATNDENIWPLAFLATAASYLVSYTTAKYEAAYGHPLPKKGFEIPASRDVRLFISMFSGFGVNVIPYVLGTISALGTLETSRRFIRMYEAK